MIHRLVLSSCRSKINIDAYWKIVPSLRTLQKKSAMVQTEFPTYVMSIIHKRFFHNSAILQLQKNKLKENGTDVIENMPTLQIKKRPTRRNKVVISDDKVPKPDVSLFQCQEIRILSCKSVIMYACVCKTENIYICIKKISLY